VHSPLTFETLAVVFFAAVAIAAPATAAPGRRRLQAALLAIVLAAGALIVAQTVMSDLRGWFGHIYLVAGYWTPALLVPSRQAEDTAFEGWLIRTDARWRRPMALPTTVVPLLELSYLLCYVIVPIAFVIVWARGTTADVDRFWTAVLLSGFLCYGSLPWLLSRPPRALDRGTSRAAGVRALNEFVLARVSHGMNTFPSGHVAVSVAAALEVLFVSPPAGLLLIVLACAIAAGAFVGRYHYGVDVAAGVLVGAASALLV
jgi:membrane-associated phospholipid phosphatase